MKRDKLNIIIILLINWSIVATAQSIEFTDLEDLPAARSALTSANNEESIFIVNGFGQNEQFTDEVYQYNISLNSWTELTAATIPKRFASSEVVDGYLYIFNGLTENGTLNSSVEKIDLSNGSIEYLSDNPQPCRAAGVAKWDNKIYSFGGTLEPNQYSDKLYQFDPANDTWTELTDIPFAGEIKGEIIDGKLYIIGGFNGSVSSSIDIYNISTGNWESSFMMPVGISAHATAVVGSKIYIVGDFSNLTSTAYFDTSDSSFEILENNLNPRRHCASEGIDGSLYVIGGNTTSSIQSSISSVQKANIVTSTSDSPKIDIINVSPNPASSYLKLGVKLEALKIYNLHGQEVSNLINVDQIDVSNLNTGIYFINGIINDKRYHSKFIKI